MPSRGRSIRFADPDWARTQEEAAIEGASACQSVRESVIARLWHARGKRGDPEYEQFLQSAQAIEDIGAD